ncbi:MAG TPA: nickel pincer cofactor biosynthesis protein LarC [Bacteroidales bacterium]|nr:nickel pincer cofactor biosynthesis protein LarC [Bacteroidales bacterium]
MKILYYECFSGISGDMNLGAMLDLGVSQEKLIEGLNRLSLEGWKIDITRDHRHGISGTKVTVITGDESASDDQGHSHDHHGRDHDHSHGHDHPVNTHLSFQGKNKENSHSHHRNLPDIENIINSSSLGQDVKQVSLKIFRNIAEAEAAVHNVPVNEIHFHEVGAVDSIIDIVGAAICFCSLDVKKVYVSDIELGGGMVKCEHGLLPVPAPATASIIKGFPVHKGGVSFEATTPTGAAIIAALAEPAPVSLRYSIEKTGYGIGQKDNPALPNILRVYLADTENKIMSGHQSFMVECNIDDMNPELSEYISARLFASGARDVFFTPVIMKKGRPAFTLSIICEEESINDIREILFTESTTIGLRIMPFMKETLQREYEEIETHFGKVVIKKSFFNGRLVSVKPEADRCAAIASETGLPMKQVIEEIMSLLKK